MHSFRDAIVRSRRYEEGTGPKTVWEEAANRLDEIVDTGIPTLDIKWWGTHHDKALCAGALTHGMNIDNIFRDESLPLLPSACNSQRTGERKRKCNDGFI